jgi:hypothetical protein
MVGTQVHDGLDASLAKVIPARLASKILLKMGDIRGFSLKTTLVDGDNFVGSMEPSDHQGTETTRRAGNGNRTWKGTSYFLVLLFFIRRRHRNMLFLSLRNPVNMSVIRDAT